MCDLKPGDEVVALQSSTDPLGRPYVPNIEKDRVYVVAGVGLSTTSLGKVLVFLQGLEWRTRDGRPGGYDAARFRKVEPKRDLAAWLQTADGREPAPRCPKVLAVLRSVAG